MNFNKQLLYCNLGCLILITYTQILTWGFTLLVNVQHFIDLLNRISELNEFIFKFICHKS